MIADALPDCPYQLRAHDRSGAWRHLRHLDCDESAAVAEAERFCEQYIVVEVIDLVTAHSVCTARCRLIA